MLWFCGHLLSFTAPVVGAAADHKLQALHQHQPDLIATANVGCQTHLAHGTNTPVMHWIELLA